MSAIAKVPEPQQAYIDQWRELDTLAGELVNYMFHVEDWQIDLNDDGEPDDRIMHMADEVIKMLEQAGKHVSLTEADVTYGKDHEVRNLVNLITWLSAPVGMRLFKTLFADANSRMLLLNWLDTYMDSGEPEPENLGARLMLFERMGVLSRLFDEENVDLVNEFIQEADDE